MNSDSAEQSRDMIIPGPRNLFARVQKRYLSTPSDRFTPPSFYILRVPRAYQQEYDRSILFNSKLYECRHC